MFPQTILTEETSVHAPGNTELIHQESFVFQGGEHSVDFSGVVLCNMVTDYHVAMGPFGTCLVLVDVSSQRMIHSRFQKPSMNIMESMSRIIFMSVTH